MNATTDWFEDDELWRMLGPSMFPPRKIEQAKVEVEDIIALLALQSGASVLDLPCGWGRHSIEFARRGFAVTAVDRTREYVNRAREFARDAGVLIDLHQADMREFSRPGAFDAALCLFTSLGYFQSRDEELAALRNYHDNLKPGGALVIELFGKEGLARQFRPRWWSEDNGVLVLADVEVLDAWTKVRNRWTIISGTERRTFEFTHWLYSAAELRMMLTEAGFVSTEFYTDLKKTPYDHNANRLVAVARKAP